MVTISDDQIRELLAATRRHSETLRVKDPMPTGDMADALSLEWACETALGIRRAKSPGGKARARKRCSEEMTRRIAMMRSA